MINWMKDAIFPGENLVWTDEFAKDQSRTDYIYVSEPLVIAPRVGVDELKPLGLAFDQLSKSVSKSKTVKSLAHLAVWTMPTAAVMLWAIGKLEKNSTVTITGTLFAVAALGIIPMFQTLKKSNSEIDLEMIRLLLPKNSEVSELALRRITWLSQNNIPLYRLDAKGKFQKLISFKWSLKNSPVFVLGTDKHRNVLGLRGPAPRGNLYFHKDDHSRLLEFEKELLSEESSEGTKKSSPTPISINEKHNQDDNRERQTNTDLRPTLKSLQFPHSRSLIYDRDRCIGFVNFVRNTRKSDPKAPHLKPSKKRDQWLGGIDVNIENWDKWDDFRKLTKNKRYAAENLSEFDKKLRSALALPLDSTIKDTPIYDKFINGSTVAFEKWLDDILKADPNAF